MPNDSPKDWDELASHRGLIEPEESRNKIPFVMGLGIGLIIGWGATYMFFMPTWDSFQGHTYSDVFDPNNAEASTSSEIDGGAVYAARCAACHQQNGGGVPGTFPPLKGSEWLDASPQLIAAIVLAGLVGEIQVDGQSYTGAMPSLGDSMSDDEIAGLIGFLQSEFNEGGKQIDAPAVAKVREKMEGHGPIAGQKELQSLGFE